LVGCERHRFLNVVEAGVAGYDGVGSCRQSCETEAPVFVGERLKRRALHLHGGAFEETLGVLIEDGALNRRRHGGAGEPRRGEHSHHRAPEDVVNRSILRGR
jgi:hypothetical protein